MFKAVTEMKSVPPAVAGGLRRLRYSHGFSFVRSTHPLPQVVLTSSKPDSISKQE